MCHNSERSRNFKVHDLAQPVPQVGYQVQRDRDDASGGNKVMHHVNTSDDDLFIGAVRQSLDDNTGWREAIEINGRAVVFKLDPGANANTMSLSTFRSVGGEMSQLQPTQSQLIGFTEQRVAPLGTVRFSCYIRRAKYEITFHITKQNYPNLLGLVDCERANLVKRIHNVNSIKPLTQADIISNHGDVFRGIGCLPTRHKIVLNSNALPVVYAPRRVPEKIKPLVGEELQRLSELGIIKRVTEPTPWVNHMVIVNKPDGSIRISMDGKDLNEAIIPSRYKLKTIEEIAANIPNAKIFTKLDAFKGFWQIELEDNSSFLCTFNTPIGRYRFTRLPFGIVDASEVFQITWKNISVI